MKKIIKQAHDAITRIKGKDYSPNVHEIQEWIDKQQEFEHGEQYYNETFKSE